MLQIIQQARRNARSTLLVAALLGLPACSGGGPTEPNKSNKVTGTYYLEEADDESLPVTIHRGAYWDPETGEFFNNYVFAIEGGYMEVREDETFYAAFDVRLSIEGQSGDATFELEGVWDETPEGLRLRVQWPVFATLKFERRDDGIGWHTDLDFLGLGDETHLDFDLFKR